MGFLGFDFCFAFAGYSIADKFVVPKSLIRKLGNQAIGYKVNYANTRIRDGPM